MKSFRVIITLTLALILFGCGSQPTSLPSGSEVPPEIKTLSDALQKAREGHLHLYAPDTFEEIVGLLNSTERNLSKAPAKAKTSLQQGLDMMATLKQKSATIKQMLNDVDVARTSAILAGADQYYQSEWNNLDQDLTDIARTLENDPKKDIVKKQKEAITGYRNLELNALKVSVLGNAETALELADEKELADFAPRTMRLAEEEYLLGTAVLNNDRRQTNKAASHAKNVIFHVEHAQSLAERISSLKEKDSSLEEILLWHESQLAKAVQPLAITLPVNQGEEAVTKVISDYVGELLAERNALAQAVDEGKLRELDLEKKRQQDLASLQESMEQEMLSVQLASDTEKRRAAEVKRRFQFVQKLFNIKEAEVFQQGQNVLIRAYGFTFKPGSSEVTEDNLNLISKIIDAIETFPNSNIEISGHTDSLGNRKTNQKLSTLRAKNVADLLSSAGGIADSRLKSTGYGPTKPVSPNDTEQGRAANRRVEVLIINPEGSL